jgi:hypothetical protein
VNSSMRLFWWVMCGVTASTWIISVVLQEFACDPIRDFFTLGKMFTCCCLCRAYSLTPAREMLFRERHILLESRFPFLSWDRHRRRYLQ